MTTQQLISICDAVLGQKHQMEPTKQLARYLRQFLVNADALDTLLADCVETLDGEGVGGGVDGLISQIKSMRERLEIND